MPALVDSTNRLRRCLSNPSCVWFGRTYFPATFTHEPAAMHHDMARIYSDRSHKRIYVTGPSGGAKSNVARAQFILDALALPGFYHGAIVGANDTTAASMLSEGVRSLIESSKQITVDFGDVKGPTWRDGAIELVKLQDIGRPRSKRRTCLIRAISTGTPVRSLSHTTGGSNVRLQQALVDDAEKAVDVGSLAEQRRFKSYVFDQLDPRLDWAGPVARLSVVGNITPNSLLTTVFTGQPYNDHATGIPYGTFDPGRVALMRGKTLRRYDCYAQDGSSYWGRWPLALLAEQREALADQPGAFDRQYRQIARPLDEDGFPAEVFADERTYGPAPTDGVAARERFQGIEIVMAFDDAETTHRSSDESAISVVGRLRDGRVLVLEMIWGRWTIGTQTERALAVWATWKPTILVGEDPRLLEDIVVKGRRAGLYVTTEKVSHGSTAKSTRIYETLRPALVHGHLQFAADHYEHRAQVQGYYDGVEHDDAIDSLQMAVARAMKGGVIAPAATMSSAFDADEDPEAAWQEAVLSL